jgi:hypothetical protein
MPMNYDVRSSLWFRRTSGSAQLRRNSVGVTSRSILVPSADGTAREDEAGLKGRAKARATSSGMRSWSAGVKFVGVHRGSHP